MPEYSNQIKRLRTYFDNHKINIRQSEHPFKSDFFKVEIQIDGNSWQLFIDDEYRDFSEANQLICLFLVLLALETYEDSDDFLDWCNENNLDSTNSDWLSYYKSLEEIYNQIHESLGSIDCCISPYEYYMGMAVADEMRDHKF